VNGFKIWAYVVCFCIILGILLHITKAYALTDEAKETSLLIAQKTPYHILYYNCWDYSTDLYYALRKEGYAPKIITGMREGIAHAWVELNGEWIEPQVGQIIANRTGYIFPGYYSYPKYNPWKKAYLDNFKR
jgi:hypothetical protein